jgi:hypothetical protein
MYAGTWQVLYILICAETIVCLLSHFAADSGHAFVCVSFIQTVLSVVSFKFYCMFLLYTCTACVRALCVHSFCCAFGKNVGFCLSVIVSALFRTVGMHKLGRLLACISWAVEYIINMCYVQGSLFHFSVVARTGDKLDRL